MFQIITLLRRILVVLLELLVEVRKIAVNTTPPPEPIPTSIRFRVGTPQSEE